MTDTEKKLITELLGIIWKKADEEDDDDDEEGEE